MKLMTLFFLLALAGCTSTTVDEYRHTNSKLAVETGDRVVILGRRQSGETEAEPEFIDCIGNKLRAGRAMQVVTEREFIDGLYPWFEPRTAPLQLKRLKRLLGDPLIANEIDTMGIRYMIWVDGNTETTEKQGSVSCSIGPGGGGCFGFATWDKASDYEAVVWDIRELTEKGRVRVDAKGSSYLLAVGAPIPFIARVQGEACDGIGRQLRSFFSVD